MRLKSARVSRAASWMETGTTTVRSLDELNYDILVEIIKRVPLYQRLYVVCLVSKSWLSAVLDSMMSTPGVINLKIMDSPELHQQPKVMSRYCCFLKHMLENKPANSWSALFLGRENLLMSRKFTCIAKRTPSLQQLVIPPTVGDTITYIWPALYYWKKLKRVQCPVRLFKTCIDRFGMVRRLWLFGVVDDVAAIAIRDRCPRLKRLSLKSCAFSINALSIILDGHKKLKFLDTRHSFRVSECNKLGKWGESKSVEWNEEEICHKAAGVKVHLRCDQQLCARCATPLRCCFPERKALLNDRKKRGIRFV